MWNRIMLIICSVFVLTGPASSGDMTRVPDRDFKLASGNRDPKGIWSDGTTMWVVDGADEKIYAYNLRSRARDPDKDFNKLDIGNDYPTGIWSDGTTMWVADANADYPKIYAYNLRSRAHDPDKNIKLSYAVSARRRGIWSDGTTMWVVDNWAKGIYAYNMRSRDREPKYINEFQFPIENNHPTGIWSDGTTMWVVDESDAKIYAYAGLSGSSNQRTQNDRGIQDFSMKIKGTTGILKICVRDHECEDGDKISVDVNGSTIFSGEIDNDWDCYTLNVWSGESYAVELTAINGTGHKGDCSYRDENTGEIRVTGENTETQVWRHRGGAGSKARIIVERTW